MMKSLTHKHHVFFKENILKEQEIEFAADIRITDDYVVFYLTGPSKEVETHVQSIVKKISPTPTFKKDEYFRYPAGSRFFIYIEWSFKSEDWGLKKLITIFRYLAKQDIYFDENNLWEEFRTQSARKAYELFLAVKKSKEREDSLTHSTVKVIKPEQSRLKKHSCMS